MFSPKIQNKPSQTKEQLNNFISMYNKLLEKLERAISVISHQHL